MSEDFPRHVPEDTLEDALAAEGDFVAQAAEDTELGASAETIESADTSLITQETIAAQEPLWNERDPNAFDEVYRRITRVLGRVIDEDDLQEATLYVFQRGSRAFRSIESAIAYAGVVARHKAIDRYRYEERRKTSSIGTAAEGFEHQSQADIADEVIASLSLDELFSMVTEDNRRLLYMAYVAGMSHKQIAAELGTTPGAARTRLSRLLSTLRKELTNPDVSAETEPSPETVVQPETQPSFLWDDGLEAGYAKIYDACQFIGRRFSEDIMHDALEVIWKIIKHQGPKVFQTTSQAASLAYTVAIRDHIDIRRAHARGNRTVSTDPTAYDPTHDRSCPGPEKEVLSSLFIIKALNQGIKLAHCRRAVYLVDVMGMSAKDAARDLNRSFGGFRWALHNGRAELKQYFGVEPPEQPAGEAMPNDPARP